MSKKIRLLLIDPHPDDEIYFFGGTLAKYYKQNLEIYICLLTNGERGNITKFDINKKSFTTHQVKSTEEKWLGKTRQSECKKSLTALRILNYKIYSLNIPNLAVDEKSIPKIKNVISVVDPHIILSFNEAGTSRFTNQDHSWSGTATFIALRDLINKKHTPKHFRRYMTYTLPDPSNYFDNYNDLNIDSKLYTKINVSNYIKFKLDACNKLKTQYHVTQYFKKVGLLNIKHETYIERINLSSVSCMGKNDLLYGLDSPSKNINEINDYISIPMPLSINSYIGTHANVAQIIIDRFKL